MLPHLPLAPLTMHPPDPGSPSIIAFGIAFGALIGGAIGRVRRLGHERTARMTASGSFHGGVIGLAVYCASPLW